MENKKEEEQKKVWKRIRGGMIITILIGAFLFYFTFTHTMDYLGCKDVKFFEGDYDIECECNFVSNVCYWTIESKFYWNGSETVEERKPTWEVMRDFGKD